MSQSLKRFYCRYLVDNGMQDFNYLFSNCLEITVELSCWKKPDEHILNTEWENNLDSLLVLLESACSSVKGKNTNLFCLIFQKIGFSLKNGYN